MVFGNMGSNPGTGVAFTRNPSTGRARFFGEFLINAQGEDVVAGIRTPEPIDQLAQEMPEVYRQLVDIYQRLERHYKDMLDLEFTVQDGKLFMLQTRVGKRTAVAALRIAVEMVEEGLIDEKTAVLRVESGAARAALAPDGRSQCHSPDHRQRLARVSRRCRGGGGVHRGGGHRPWSARGKGHPGAAGNFAR